jgi:hypothetical protein
MLFAVVEYSSELGSSGTGQDFAYDLAYGIVGTVAGRWGIGGQRGLGRVKGTTAKKVVSGGAGACFGGR